MDSREPWRNDPFWDDELSQNKYFYPLSIDHKSALREGNRLALIDPAEEIYRVGSFVCSFSPESHYGPWVNAVDFLIPDGTPVLAALDGEIIEVKELSSEWGPNKEYADMLNYITLKHEGDEYSQYCHLAQWSVRERGLIVGGKVKRGQRIGTVGKTGWTDRDHLHFIVFRSIKASESKPFPSSAPSFKSLKIQFKSRFLQWLMN